MRHHHFDQFEFPSWEDGESFSVWRQRIGKQASTLDEFVALTAEFTSLKAGRPPGSIDVHDLSYATSGSHLATIVTLCSQFLDIEVAPHQGFRILLSDFLAIDAVWADHDSGHFNRATWQSTA